MLQLFPFVAKISIILRALKAANLLAIDSPVGVGWSFAVDGNINTTDEQVISFIKFCLHFISVAK